MFSFPTGCILRLKLSWQKYFVYKQVLTHWFVLLLFYVWWGMCFCFVFACTAGWRSYFCFVFAFWIFVIITISFQFASCTFRYISFTNNKKQLSSDVWLLRLRRKCQIVQTQRTQVKSQRINWINRWVVGILHLPTNCKLF